MLAITQLSKAFQQKTILQEVNFTLQKNQVLSILGKSGSGKTTLLKILAGLEYPDQGEVKVNGKSVLNIPPHRRKIVYLYQESLLFPHLNVFENVAFGLKLQKHPKNVVKEKTNQLLEALGLSDQAEKMPHQISGGQKQRVSFGRALIIEPQLLLLDEPFGSLDPGTREQMQELLKQMIAQYQITGLFVTHDVKEAILMGDQIALMQNGQLRTFQSLNEFIEDKQTGAKAEMEFWKRFSS